MQQFRLQSRKIYLKYNECSLTLEQVNEQLHKKLVKKNISNFIIAKNKNNTQEISVFIECEKKIYKKNINYFNLIIGRFLSNSIKNTLILLDEKKLIYLYPCLLSVNSPS